MSAVKEMVQAVGGRVGLRSVAGKACEFRITLPVPPQPKGVPGAMRDE